MKITLNGQVYEFEQGTNALDMLAQIDADLRKDEELDAEFQALEGYDD